MSGALAERVFVKKLENVGFDRIEVVDRQPFGLADVSRYPLFTADLLELMEELLDPATRREVATAITVRAEKRARAMDVPVLRRKDRRRTGTA